MNHNQLAREFMDPQGFERIRRSAANSMRNAQTSIMVLGYTFAPWLRLGWGVNLGMFVEMAIGALIGRFSAKKMAFALQAESQRVEAGTVWLMPKGGVMVNGKRTPMYATSIGGILPIGTKVLEGSGVRQTIRIGRIKIGVPIFFKAILPPKPWRFRSAYEARTALSVKRWKPRYRPPQRAPRGGSTVRAGR